MHVCMKGSHSPFERGKTLCKADLLCLAALARCAGTPKLQPQQQQQCKKQVLLVYRRQQLLLGKSWRVGMAPHRWTRCSCKKLQGSQVSSRQWWGRFSKTCPQMLLQTSIPSRQAPATVFIQAILPDIIVRLLSGAGWDVLFCWKRNCPDCMCAWKAVTLRFRGLNLMFRNC